MSITNCKSLKRLPLGTKRASSVKESVLIISCVVKARAGWTALVSPVGKPRN